VKEEVAKADIVQPVSSLQLTEAGDRVRHRNHVAAIRVRRPSARTNSKAAVLLRRDHALDLRQQSALLLWQRSTVLIGMKENGAPPL
jgi:hypothetical protein